MLKNLFSKRKPTLEKELAKTDAKLALLNAQLAAKMVKLAGQTDDLEPLAQAEEALASARRYYTYEETPVEICLVQTALGDMLLRLGRAKQDRAALERAQIAYRAAITLASLQGDETLRRDLRDKMRLIDSLLGKRPPVPSLFKVA